MILKVTLRDREGSIGTPVRRAQSIELEAEANCDLEMLGELAVILASRGATTAHAVREVVEKMKLVAPGK